MLLTQCKKSEAESPSDGKPVNITLNVGGDSKIDVNTVNGKVTFTSGDKIYVASGGVYVGTLTAQDGKTFSGTIFGPKEGEPLQFFFLGNKTPNEELTAGTTDELTINISNQSEGLPVISYAPSKEIYPSNDASYSAFLLNKCALVKFDVRNYTGSGTVGIKGMNNQVTVALNDNSFNYGEINDGKIILNKNNNEYWAILLPQNAVEGGEAYSSDGWTGNNVTVPEITINQHLNEGIAVNLTAPASLSRFSVSETTKVEFSPGNLYYDGISSSWNFEAHQWDYRTLSGKSAFFDGKFNTTPTNHWGLFGWSGNGATAAWGMSTSTNNADYSGTFEDWGKAMDETGNTWRTLKLSEWEYLLTTRKVNGNTGFGHTCVWMELSNKVEGLIIFPDGYTGETTDLKEIPDGAVFLPAAGWFSTGTITAHQKGGFYRSSELRDNFPTSTKYLSFSSTNVVIENATWNPLYYKYSVRLVRDCSK